MRSSLHSFVVLFLPTAQGRHSSVRSKRQSCDRPTEADRRVQARDVRSAEIKKRSTTEFSIYLDSEDGKQELTLLYQAIGATAYDKLIAKHPPTAEQRVEGSSFNIDTFAPALIAASAWSRR